MRNNNSKRIKIISLAIFGLFLLSVPITSLIIGPQELIDSIGLSNGYILAFVVSFFAGFSALTILSFYSMLISLIVGGLNPVLLGLIAGLSIASGDIILYYFCRTGRDLITGKIDTIIERGKAWFEKKNRIRWVPSISYLYMSFAPLPNDWLLLLLASIRYPRSRIYPIILLGDITHAIVITLLASKGIYLFV